MKRAGACEVAAGRPVTEGSDMADGDDRLAEKLIQNISLLLVAVPTTTAIL